MTLTSETTHSQEVQELAKTLSPISMEDYLEVVAPGVIRLKGHRIGLEHIVERYLDGYSPEQMAEDFPGVSLEQIYVTITFYLRHRTAVEAYIAGLDAQAEAAYRAWAANPSPATLRLRALKAQQQRG